MAGNDVFVRRGGGDGPALFLLHGLGATGEVWDGLMRTAARPLARAWVVPDLPGHGRSAPPPGAATPSAGWPRSRQGP